jgi:uncharacterized protein YbjT (DUF2867 family)
MKILVTGAAGYVGRRLVYRLLKETGHDLNLFVMNRNEVQFSETSRIKIFEGSTFDEKSLDAALEGVECAYYLIHSMGAAGDFEKLDKLSAENFRDSCMRNNVKRVVYLGGLGVKDDSSPHLRSRIETGEILSDNGSRYTAIWFRAGIIIGSGSASFEILKNLAQKLPVLITPKWVETKTEPVFIDDVVSYLIEASVCECEKNLEVDIGSEVMSFSRMIKRASEIMGLKRIIVPVPFFTPKLSSYWLVFITPVPLRIAAPLVEGLRHETVRKNSNAAKFFPDISPVKFDEAIRKALHEAEINQVISRWSDGTCTPGVFCEPSSFAGESVFKIREKAEFKNIPPEKIFMSMMKAGGKTGWYRYHFLWSVRGAIDKISGGYGLGRGRRDSRRLRTGDSVDFWKVVDIVENKRILLFAEMKLPGRGWLEFLIEDKNAVVTAYFIPDGLIGRLYWMSMHFFHKLIFRDMVRSIIKNS